MATMCVYLFIGHLYYREFDSKTPKTGQKHPKLLLCGSRAKKYGDTAETKRGKKSEDKLVHYTPPINEIPVLSEC